MRTGQVVLRERRDIMTKASVGLAVLLWSAFTPAAIADVVHDNYLPANGHGFGAYTIREKYLFFCCFSAGFPPNLDHAMAFTVPPGIDYQLDRIELTMAILRWRSNVSVNSAWV
jgi:hypothetical protein